jgi:hypothetical protein
LGWHYFSDGLVGSMGVLMLWNLPLHYHHKATAAFAA